MKLDRKQDFNVLYQVCVFQADWKNKMAALASDWLRHFRLFLWNRRTACNETWTEKRSQRPLPSWCFLGWIEKQDGRPDQSVKKVAHCTQVHDMWPFGPLVQSLNRTGMWCTEHAKNWRSYFNFNTLLMPTKYNRRTIKLNFFSINISLGMHISCVEYEFTRWSNKDFTSTTKCKGRNFISKNDAKTRRPGAAHCCQACVTTNKLSFQTSVSQFRHTNWLLDMIGTYIQ